MKSMNQRNGLIFVILAAAFAVLLVMERIVQEVISAVTSPWFLVIACSAGIVAVVCVVRWLQNRGGGHSGRM